MREQLTLLFSLGEKGGTGLVQAVLALTLADQGKFDKAIGIVRARHFLRAAANGALGEFLTAQARFTEAESFLLASCRSLEKSQAENSPRTQRARQRLVSLYENWGRTDTASIYRNKLSKP